MTARRLLLTAAHPRARLTGDRSGNAQAMPSKSANVKNEKQYEGLKKKGMSKQRAAKIANSPGASKRGGQKSGSNSGSYRSTSKQGGTTQQRKEAGRKGGKAAAKKRWRPPRLLPRASLVRRLP